MAGKPMDQHEFFARVLEAFPPARHCQEYQASVLGSFECAIFLG